MSAHNSANTINPSEKIYPYMGLYYSAEFEVNSRGVILKGFNLPDGVCSHVEMAMNRGCGSKIWGPYKVCGKDVVFSNTNNNVGLVIPGIYRLRFCGPNVADMEEASVFATGVDPVIAGIAFQALAAGDCAESCVCEDFVCNCENIEAALIKNFEDGMPLPEEVQNCMDSMMVGSGSSFTCADVTAALEQNVTNGTPIPQDILEFMQSTIGNS